MEETDYDDLLRHSAMLKNAIAIVENLREFRSVAELEAVQSVTQQLQAAALETNGALERIAARRSKASVSRGCMVGSPPVSVKPPPSS